MKVRADFVTNSSSSSFLLTFKDKNSIYDTLKKQFPTVENSWSAGKDGYFTQLFKEINESHYLSKDEIVSLIKDESYDIEWNLGYKLRREKNMSYSEANDYIQSEEGQNLVKQMIDERTNNVLKTIGDNAITVEVEHGDGGEGEDGVLEHEILPYLDCTVIRFSHH